MTIAEIMNSYEDEYNYLEVYRPVGNRRTFHTDSIASVGDDFSLDDYVLSYELMDKEEYENTILANCGIKFNDCFADSDIILAVLIK